MTSQQPTMGFMSRALAHTVHSAYARTSVVASSLVFNIVAAVALLPTVSAQADPGYVNIDGPDHTYAGFVAGPVNSSFPNADKIFADIHHFTQSGLNWPSLKARAEQIRANGNTRDTGYCYGNLSLALDGLGAAYLAGAAGASTLLTLLPTAGALIGAPARELWVLYKLMPVAGILSMMLSLGGNIVPLELNAYERTETFQHQGVAGVHSDETSMPKDKTDDGFTQADMFAREVGEVPHVDSS